MKKLNYLMLIFLLLIMITPVAAQFQFGVIVGLNIMHLDGSYKDATNIDNVSYKSFGLGAIATYNITTNIAIQTEPMFCSKGGQSGMSGVDYKEISIGYFELPLLFKYSFGAPFIIIGAYKAYRFGADYTFRAYEISYGGWPTDKVLEENLNIQDEIKNRDAGMIFGVGANIESGKGTVIIQLQYSKGFNNILKIKDDNNSLINRGIHLKIGFAFSYI